MYKLTLDMNHDGLLTVADMWLWICFPGDLFLNALNNSALLEFLEVSNFTQGSFLSFIITAVIIVATGIAPGWFLCWLTFNNSTSQTISIAWMYFWYYFMVFLIGILLIAFIWLLLMALSGDNPITNF